MVPNKGPEIYPPNVKLDADPPRFYNSTTMKSAQFQCGQSGRIYGKMQRATGGDRHTGQERPLSQGEVIIIQLNLCRHWRLLSYYVSASLQLVLAPDGLIHI